MAEMGVDLKPEFKIGKLTGSVRTAEPVAEVCRSRSITVDSGRSQRFSAEWIILIGTESRAGVIFNQSDFKILMFIYTVRKLWQESNRSRSRLILYNQESYQEQESIVKTQERSSSLKNQTLHTSSSHLVLLIFLYAVERGERVSSFIYLQY